MHAPDLREILACSRQLMEVERRDGILKTRIARLIRQREDAQLVIETSDLELSVLKRAKFFIDEQRRECTVALNVDRPYSPLVDKSGMQSSSIGPTSMDPEIYPDQCSPDRAARGKTTVAIHKTTSTTTSTTAEQ